MAENVFAHRVIRASAGSGKTFKLSERYLRLLLAGVPADSILATTFTRKAAGEIQSRILERLGKGALSEEGASNLSRELFEGDPNRITREQLRDLVVEVTHSLDKLRISTLDSFFMKIAGGFEFEIGLPPGWRITDEADEAQLLRRAIQATFARADSESAYELSKRLFKGETKRDVESQILAIVRSALELCRGSSPQDWTRLGTYATPGPSIEECADALRRAQLPLKKSSSKKNDADADDDARYNQNFVKARKALLESLESKDWPGALGNGLCKAAIEGTFSYYRIPFEEDLKEAVANIVDAVKNLSLLDIANRLAALRFVTDAIEDSYAELKRETGSYRFDDLAETLARLELDRQLGKIIYRLDAKTSHILLDEFQDASFKQWSIIRPFAKSITERAPSPSEPQNPEEAAALASFFCVGDVKQAIYGWRGGVAEIFDEIENTLPNVERAGMDRNWRSCPTIIDVVNKLFLSLSTNSLWDSDSEEEEEEDARFSKGAAVREAVAKWKAGFQKHLCAPKNEELDGFWSLEAAPRFDESSDPPALAREKYAPVDRFRGLDEPSGAAVANAATNCDYDLDEEDEEAAAVGKSDGALQKKATLAYAVERIVQLHERYPNYSIGVLVRTNRCLSNIIKGLKARGIEASAEGGAPLADSPAVLAALALVKLAAHPGDTVAAFHIANIPPFSERFHITTRNYAEAAKGLSAYLRDWIQTTGIGRFTASARDMLRTLDLDSRSRERLDKFVEASFSYEQNADAFQLDRYINAMLAAKAESPTAADIRVMTIHGSKGLEFDIVVLPELDASAGSDLVKLEFDGLFAGRKTPLAPVDSVVNYVGKEQRKLLPDEYRKIFTDEQRKRFDGALCLLYVAITRPVRALVAIINPPTIRHDSKDELFLSKDKTLSFANILRYGLANGVAVCGRPSPYFKHAQILFQAGTPDWDRKDKRAETVADTESAAFAPLPYRRTDRRRALFSRTSPTESEAVLRWDSRGSYQGGSAFHACLEQTRWLDQDGVPDDATLERVLRPILKDGSKIRQTIGWFRDFCKSDFARNLLSIGSYRNPGGTGALAPFMAEEFASAPRFELSCERAFSTLRGEKLLRGVIDRLIVLWDGDRPVAAEILDYKTDRFRDETGAPISDPRHWPREALDHYRAQLAEYGRIVAGWTSLPEDRIRLTLAFTSHRTKLDARELESADDEVMEDSNAI